MSGVVLSGRRGGMTHHAVGVLAELPAELTLIGGLAVMCRVGTPHRATVDLDAITRDLDSRHEELAGLALTASGGGQYRFDGDVELDVIDVAPSDAQQLLELLSTDGEILTDLEINAVGHAWAHDHATPLDVRVIDDETGALLVAAQARPVATLGGLVAMKATTVPLRASSRPEKRASDLYDLGRLILFGPPLWDEVAAMPDGLREIVTARIASWFVDPKGRDRTFREVRRFDDPRLDLDDVADAAEELIARSTP